MLQDLGNSGYQSDHKIDSDSGLCACLLVIQMDEFKQNSFEKLRSSGGVQIALTQNASLQSSSWTLPTILATF